MQDFLQLSFADLHQFHFLRPAWLLAIIPIALLIYLKTKFSQQSQWSQIIPLHLANVLLKDTNNKSSKFPTLLTLICVLTVVALAGPVWQKIEKPVFEVKRASVILMDMSLSMRATDIKPDRLTKAKFKAIDLAKAITDGEVALVAYAGDAFTISPLTPDAKNLTTLIPSLTPEIMPESGSYPLLGLEKAADLMKQAGYVQGDIFWFTDGIDQSDVDELTEFVSKMPYRLNILGIGSSQGAPIKQADGSLLKDHTGSIVIPKLNNARLAPLAGITGGLYQDSSVTDDDIKRFASLAAIKREKNQQDTESEQPLTGDDWQEFGPYLVLLIMPFVLMVFRRGAVIAISFGLLSLMSPQEVLANTSNTQHLPPESQQTTESVVSETSWLDTIFTTKDQKATQAFQADNFAQAQQDFEHQNWKASAAYKAGDYQTAAELFAKDKTAQGYYNKGNALAHSGDITSAIKAYEEALKQQPDMQQAKENKEMLEKMQQEQEQQDSDQSQEQDQQNGENQDQQNAGENGEQSEGSEQQESQDSSEQQSDEQQGSEQENSKQEQQDQPSEQESQQESQQTSAQEPQETGEQNAQEDKNAQAQQQDQEQTEQQNEQANFQPLTPEQVAEQEQQQKIQQLLRKVQDDPATLLRNKMYLESKKRQQYKQAPKGAKKSW